jgi:uncharacterized protein YqfB (UPF0267 family)
LKKSREFGQLNGNFFIRGAKFFKFLLGLECEAFLLDGSADPGYLISIKGKEFMKNLVLIALLGVAPSAFADNWSDHCKGATKPELVLSYPTEVISDVTGGKVTATVRKSVRCFQKGDVLVLKDSKTNAVVGNVKLEEVFFSKFNSISPKVVARSGEANMPALQNKLVTIYGETIRTESLTELYFSFVK